MSKTSSSASKSKSRFSAGTKFTLKSTSKKKRSKHDKIEMEDSGVQLDDPGCANVPSVCLDQVDADVGVCLQDAHAASQSDLSCSMSQPSGHIPTPLFTKHCAISAPDLTSAQSGGQRLSKSESPRPPSRCPSPGGATLRPPDQVRPRRRLAPPSAGCDRCSGSLESAGQTSAVFSIGADSDDDVDVGARRRESDASSHASSHTSRDTRASRDKNKHKNRFKKILKPLKRSQSAGNTKDVPAHALFLRHDITKERRTPPSRRSIDTGRGSMERQSDESESDQEQTDSKSSTSTGKPKKKSLAQDMKEKFSFLRRRPTDTSLPSKDGKLPKPTKEMVINWSTSFDALLKDKVGMELFKDFLRTEFSEENVEFWIACEEYKNVKSNKLNARAEEIFSDYVAVQAPREINLDSKTRMATKDLMEKPDRQTFELAQKRIQALMDKDSYPRFLRSDVYQKLLSEYKIQLTLT